MASLPSNTSKIKPLFPTKAKWRCLTPSDVTFINKYKPKMLKNLEISHFNDDKIKGKSLRELRKALADNKTASSLRIQRETWQNFSRALNHLGSLFNSSNHSQKLVFNCNDNRSDQMPNRNAIKSLTRLGRCKNLKSLEINFSCQDESKNQIINRLSSQLQGLRKLKEVNLDISRCSKLSFGRGPVQKSDANEPLFRFKYPQSLSSLDLVFGREGSIKQDLLSIFTSNLERCKLKSLNLNLNFLQTRDTISPLFKASANSLETLKLMQNFFEQNIDSFLEDFGHLKHLNTLDLHIMSNLTQDQFKLFIMRLYSHLASFPNFRSLTLRVSNRTDHPLEWNLVFPPPKSLKKLEQLEIGFPAIANISFEHLQSLSQALQHLQCLKKLYLNFDSSDISPEGISSLAQSFQNLKCLKDLSLQARYTNLNYKAVETVWNSLTHLPLENVYINLGQPSNLEENQQTSISAILSALSTLNGLKSLTLNFSAFKFSAQESEQFCRALSKLKQLSSLGVSLPQFDSVTNKPNSLSSLRELPKLSWLNVSFPQEKIGDEEVCSVISHLQACKYLRTLSFWFQDAEKLTEEAIRYLSMGFKELKSLKELQFNFGRKEQFSDESVIEFFKSLTAIKTLERLNFGMMPSKHNPELLKLAGNLVEKEHKWRYLTDFTINYRVI